MFALLAAAVMVTGTPSPEVTAASGQEVLNEVRREGASAVVLNFWATWCQPCREEFPDIVRIEKEYRERGVRVIFVSTDFIDDREQARKFLASQGVTTPTLIKGDTNDNRFIDTVEPRWTGIIPSTVVYDGGGQVKWFHEGKTDYANLKKAIDGVLAAGAATPTPKP